MPFGTGLRTCIGVHLARMVIRLVVAEFFRNVRDVRPAPGTTKESMELENYFLVQPRSHKCEIIIS